MYQDIKSLEDLQFDRFIGKISKDGPLNEEDLNIPMLSAIEEEKLMDCVDTLKPLVPESREVHERLRPPERFLVPYKKEEHFKNSRSNVISSRNAKFNQDKQDPSKNGPLTRDSD